jgi:hypothetical protein
MNSYIVKILFKMNNILEILEYHFIFANKDKFFTKRIFGFEIVCFLNFCLKEDNYNSFFMFHSIYIKTLNIINFRNQ